MKKFITLRNDILTQIKCSIYYLRNIGYISNGTYKHIEKKKFITKNDISKVLHEFDGRYFGADTICFSKANKRIVTYGTSQMGKELKAYVINDGDNVSKTILVTGELHGYEGAFKQDGICLTRALESVANYYANISKKTE